MRSIPSRLYRPLLYRAYLRLKGGAITRIPHDKERQNGWRALQISSFHVLSSSIGSSIKV
jgi:hypothetical protein